MLVQVYLTFFAIIAIIVGTLYVILRRPFIRRWRKETEIEQEHERQAEAIRRARPAAEQELDAWLHAELNTPKQTTTVEKKQDCASHTTHGTQPNDTQSQENVR